jgi:FixJ family two-component response regulator
MLENNWNTNELMNELKTKDGIASMNPTAYAFGLCYAQLTSKQKEMIAKIVNGMENKKEDN